MKAREFITEAWSQKYKSSINCSHPKGFSQRAHCAGKKKHNESREMEMVCEDCGMCRTHGDHMMETAERLDAKCWSGMHKAGTKIKGGVRVNNCVPNESIDEAANAAQQAAIAINMKKHHQKPKGVAENNHWHDAGVADARRDVERNPDRQVKTLNPRTQLKTMQDKQARHPEEVEQYSLGYRSINPAESICSLEEAHEIFDDFEQAMAERGLTEDAFDTVTDEQIIRETAAWRRKAGKSAKGGLNRKGVASYRREHPGSHLQMAVTTKPSKLKPGSKAAKRRKSFCARMSGVKGPMKKPNGKPTRKALALRKWNC